MTVTFTCAHCHTEYVKGKSDDEVLETFKRWYPKADIRSAKLVCETCYLIAIRMLQLRQEQQNWIDYATNN